MRGDLFRWIRNKKTSVCLETIAVNLSLIRGDILVEIDSIDKHSAVGTEYITSLQDSGTFLVVLLLIFSSYGTSGILKLTAMVRRQTEDKRQKDKKRGSNKLLWL